MARRDLADVVTMVRAYQRNFPDEKTPGLLLMGDPGSGKTHSGRRNAANIIGAGS